MDYNLISVKEALEVFYCLGYDEIDINYFIQVFSKKYQKEAEKEQRRVRLMLRTLENKKMIQIAENDVILLNNITFSICLRLSLIG